MEECLQLRQRNGLIDEVAHPARALRTFWIPSARERSALGRSQVCDLENRTGEGGAQEMDHVPMG